MAKGKHQHTTPEEAESILRLFAKYKHPRPIADELELDLPRVTRVLKRNGIQAKWGKAGVCNRHHDQVERMAREGATCQEIAVAIGSNNTQVGRYIRHHEMWRPPHRRHPQGKSPKARNTRGSNNPAWRGGRHQDKHGYVMLWMPSHPEANVHGYVREHRLVMAAKLGQALRPGEVVDHINGVTDDNRPENLRVFPSNGEHLRATLTGVPCPQRGRRKRSTQNGSGNGAQGSPGFPGQSQESPGRDQLPPSGKDAPSESGRPS